MLQLCRNKNGGGGQFGFKGENKSADTSDGKLQVILYLKYFKVIF